MKKKIIHNATISKLVILFVVVAICSAAVLLKRKGHFLSGTSSSPLAVRHSSQISELNKQKALQAYGNLPLSFEVNQGQTDSQVKFFSRGSGYSLFLTSTEAVLALSKTNTKKAADAQPSTAVAPALLRMQLLGANPSPRVSGLEELPGKSNYFIGNDPQKWRTNVANYTRVRLEDVYPGVDMIYYGNQRQLEYDLAVSAGADPKAIVIGFKGTDRVEISGDGDLVLQTAGGEVRQHKPIAYQEVNGVRQEVTCSFALKEKNQIGFEVAAYDVTKPLVIDPVLTYSTYLGSSDGEAGFAIAADASGNAYVTGWTWSLNFPTANALQPNNAGHFDTNDAFVTKLNADGSALVYSTYLGGSRSEPALSSITGIVVDASGNAYVIGSTISADFPTANALQPNVAGLNDAFVTKLNAQGSALVYSTYLGGSRDEIGLGIAVDPSGNAYVTGNTNSINFPLANALQPNYAGGLWDAFVVKLNAQGSALVYSTYLGGNNPFVVLDGEDWGVGIAADAFGNAYVTGSTDSINFPTANAVQPNKAGNVDAFVTKLNAQGSALVYSTYLGGAGIDVAQGIATDASGNAYVTGSTNSANFPTTNALQNHVGGSEAFVTKLNADGSALVYSTYLGGSHNDSGRRIVVDAYGNAYVVGETQSTNFPTVNALQSNYGGDLDAFVTKLNADGSALVYSTYLGGSEIDVGKGIAIDSSGNAYLTGFTSSSNFPTANALQPNYAGGVWDAFIVKISEAAPMISAVPVTRSRGSAVSNSTIASIDAEDAVQTLTVTVNGGPWATVNGVTVSNIAESAAGLVTADVEASCGATTAGFTLRVTGSNSLFTEATLNVTVTPDDAPPVISLPADIVTSLPLNSADVSQVVNFTVTATDNCDSNPAITVTPASGSTFPVGTTTVNVIAADSVGNSTTGSFTVTVLYNFLGFVQPVNNLPTVNIATAGASIPVRFSLSGHKGLSIFAAGYPVSQVIACNSGAPSETIEETTSAGNSGLTYDVTIDQYKYVWKTDKTWKGTCRQLILKLNDGSLRTANFEFK